MVRNQSEIKREKGGLVKTCIKHLTLIFCSFLKIMPPIRPIEHQIPLILEFQLNILIA